MAESSGFDCIKNLATELEQLEGVQRQDPDLGTTAEGQYFYNKYTNRLFGAPFQLMHTVDYRFSETNASLGNEYLRNFILNAPILEIKAGIPMYTYEKDVYNMIADKQVSGKEFTWADALYQVYNLFMGIEPEARMFTFSNRYIEYMAHVNYMCRSMAYLLNLQIEGKGPFPSGVHINGASSLTPYNKIRWENYRMTQDTTVSEQNSGEDKSLWEKTKDAASGAVDAGKKWFARKYPKLSTLAAWAGIMDVENLQEAVEKGLDYGTKFLVEPISVTENLKNDTMESSISRAINGLSSSIGTEVAFLNDTEAFSGLATGTLSFLADKASALTQSVTELVAHGLGESYIQNLLKGGFNSLRGQRMIYPNIYEKSSYSHSYEFVVHLNSPYGDVYNYYINIIVPLMHLICLAAPRLVTGNGLKSPYIVQACIPGMCTIEMGIISSMSIEKNKSTSHVSVDGFPLEVDVRFTVEELYDALPISSAFSPESFLANESLNNYLCNMAGLRPSHDAKLKVLELNKESLTDYKDSWLDNYLRSLATGQEGA